MCLDSGIQPLLAADYLLITVFKASEQPAPGMQTSAYTGHCRHWLYLQHSRKLAVYVHAGGRKAAEPLPLPDEQQEPVCVWRLNDFP
jgi:hypothetical protein